jgi:hypothetical protein
MSVRGLLTQLSHRLSLVGGCRNAVRRSAGLEKEDNAYCDGMCLCYMLWKGRLGS